MKVARLVAYLFLGVAALNSAHVIAQQSNDTSAGPPPITDPLAKELDRCRQLNEKAASDERCDAAYKESRKRFFQPPADYHPAPMHMNPGIPEPKLVKPDQPQDK
jgi:conjugative transfer region protein TrbK